MRMCSLGFALAGLVWLPGVTPAHRISFSGEIYCPDLTGDDEVDLDDVALLLVRFGGECPEDTGCEADFNHSHTVGEGDLRVALGNWGPCALSGDANRDGAVDAADRAAIEADLGLDCRADLDHSGRVGGHDLAIAESAWGAGQDHHPGSAEVDGSAGLSPLDLQLVFDATGRDCRSDINHDGVVDGVDLTDLCEVAGICAPP